MLAPCRWSTLERGAQDSLRPKSMWDILFYLLVIVFVGGLAIAGLYFVRNNLQGGGSGAGLFGSRGERRLDVVEQSSVDGRRRLVLVRRDDVEHLIMTGGPVDVVIETNIQPRRSRAVGDIVEPPQPVFSRPQRAFGTSAASE